MRDSGSLVVELVSAADPREIIRRLVEYVAESIGADRCTLSSLDEDVIRIEASYEPGSGIPEWVGREYALSAIDDQPLLKEAVTRARIVTGGAFDEHIDRTLERNLQDVKRLAIIPLMIEDQVAAVLILSRKEDQPFGDDDLANLQQLGTIAILALRNARALQAVRRAQDRGLQALTLVSEQLAATATQAQFFGGMSRSIAGLVHAERAAFWMVEGDELVAQRDAHGFKPDVLERMRVTIDPDPEGPLQRLLQGGQALGGRGLDLENSNYRETLEIMGMKDVKAVPWRTAQQTLGMLIATDSEGGFTDEDQWVLRISARASALVWQMRQAEKSLAEAQEREVGRLREHADRLLALDREKSEFLMVASHELRTPITLVNGYISLLKEGALGELRPDAVQVLDTVAARVAQMKILVNQMLAAARGEDHPATVNPVPIEVVERVRRVAADLQGLCKQGQTLAVEVTEPDVPAFGDPEHVDMIVGNLVSNAIKFSPAGSAVRVVVTGTPREARVAVIDTGIGISEADLPRLFSRFSRVGTTEGANVEGTGLGLYISRQLSRRQGGDITVSSAPGKGSTFTLTLPGTEAEEGRPQER